MPKTKLKDALLDEKVRLLECLSQPCLSDPLRSAYQDSLQSIQNIIKICVERNRF